MTKHFTELSPNKANYRIPPVVQTMMTGATYASQTPDGVITLTYTDGTTECRPSEKDLMEFESFFHVVSFVQG